MEYDDDAAASEYLEYDYYDCSITAEDHEYCHVWPVTFFSVLQGTGAAVGLLANSLLLLLMAATPCQRRVYLMYLLQRAVAEVLNLMPVLWHIAFRESNELKMNAVMCKTLNVVMYVGMVADPVFLMLFAMDSYLASRPQHHTLVYRRKVMWLTSAAAWLLTAAIGIVAYLLTSISVDGYCIAERSHAIFVVEVFVVLVVPLVVVWVFVRMALLPRPATPTPEERNEGPNRRLMLGLASSFTVLHGLYYFVLGLSQVLLFNNRSYYVIETTVYSFPMYSVAINPTLVICLTKELRQKVAGWLPALHSDTLPLQNL